jgi:hypothetical protein
MLEPARRKAGSGLPASAPSLWQPVQSMNATKYSPRLALSPATVAAVVIAAAVQDATVASSKVPTLQLTAVFPLHVGACRQLAPAGTLAGASVQGEDIIGWTGKRVLRQAGFGRLRHQLFLLRLLSGMLVDDVEVDEQVEVLRVLADDLGALGQLAEQA